MRPIQMLRAWTKKERKTADPSNDLAKRSGLSSLRSRTIRHIPHDIEDWLNIVVSSSTDNPPCRNNSLSVSELKRSVTRRFPHPQSSPRQPSLSISNLSSDYIPPRRPPRPPSLYSPIPSRSEYALPRSLPSNEFHGDNTFSQNITNLPDLDRVWEQFLKDTNEDPDSLLMEIFPRKEQNSRCIRSSRTLSKPTRRMQDDRDRCVVESPGYPQYSYSYAIASSPHVPYTQSDEKCMLSDDNFTPHSPPLNAKKVPNPLVLSSPTTPSTESSSYDSTPVATPTTPSSPPCFQNGNRPIPPHHNYSNSSSIDRFPLVPEPISQPQFALAHTVSESLPSLVRTSSSSTLSSSNYQSTCNSDFDDSQCSQMNTSRKNEKDSDHWGYAV